MRPYLSIVVPAHNSEATIGRLLDSIFVDREKEIEVIVVDDASFDQTVDTVAVYQKRKYPVLLEALDKQKGPAHARNTGARKARGEVLLFLDSDVIVHPGTIDEVISGFQKKKYRVAMTGVWDKKQTSGSFFPKFKALRDWSYWVNERKTDAYYYLFSTRIAAIRRDVFLELGGFNESFNGADVEDIEFTYRIAKAYRVDFNEKMRVSHEFPGFLPIARKYFKRSFQWMGLFLGRKKFDPVAATGGEAMTAFSAVGFLFFLPLGIIFWPFFIPSLFFFLWHLFGVRKFLRFVYVEQGGLFAFYSFIMGMALYLFIFLGALWAFSKFYIKKLL